MVCLKTDALTETLSCAGLNGVREAGLTVSIVLLNSHPHPVFNPRYFLILEPYCGRVNVASNQLDRTVSVANKREVARKFGIKHKKNVGKHKHEQNSNWSIFQSSQSSTSKTSRCVHRDRLPYDKLMTLLGRQVMHCGHVARLQRMLHSWSVLLEGFFGDYSPSVILSVFLSQPGPLLSCVWTTCGPRATIWTTQNQPIISSFGPWVEDWVSEKPTHTKKD